MANHTLLHIDDFIEMLERGDSLESIASYAHITPQSAERRFERLPKEIRDRIRAKRVRLEMGMYA